MFDSAMAASLASPDCNENTDRRRPPDCDPGHMRQLHILYMSLIHMILYQRPCLLTHGGIPPTQFG